MWKGELLNSRHPGNYLDSKALSWTKSAVVIYLGHISQMIEKLAEMSTWSNNLTYSLPSTSLRNFLEEA